MRTLGKGEHWRAKWCFDISQEFSQHLQGFLGLNRQITPAMSHLASSAGLFLPCVSLIITARHKGRQELCQQCCSSVPQLYVCSVIRLSPPGGDPGYLPFYLVNFLSFIFLLEYDKCYHLCFLSTTEYLHCENCQCLHSCLGFTFF